uniref:Uncharacterized protein n=1 Tax=Cucumis melo TaxID=3656 RepID=A0A9I9EFZ3_CUCME
MRLNYTPYYVYPNFKVELVARRFAAFLSHARCLCVKRLRRKLVKLMLLCEASVSLDGACPQSCAVPIQKSWDLWWSGSDCGI